MTAVELMSTMAPLIGWELTESAFVPKLLELCSSTQLNVRLICATKIGDFCAVVSQDMIEKSLLPCFVQLTLDSMWNVRKACAQVIMSVSCACSLELRKRTLAPIFARFLQDDSRWVRVTAFQTLGPFITTFAQPSITGLAYNQSGELVLVNPDGFEFKCPVIGESMNNIMNCMELGMSMSNAAAGGGLSNSSGSRDGDLNNSNNSTNSTNTSNGNTIMARQNAILAAHEDEEDDEDDDGYDMTMEEDSYENEEEDEEDQVIDYSGGGVVGRIETSGVVETEARGGRGASEGGEMMDENFNYFHYWRDPIPSVSDVEEIMANSTNLLKLSDSFNNLCSLVESPSPPTLLPLPPPVPSNPPPTTSSTPSSEQQPGSNESAEKTTNESNSNTSETTTAASSSRRPTRRHRVKSKLGRGRMLLSKMQQDEKRQDTAAAADSSESSSNSEKQERETLSDLDEPSRTNETTSSHDDAASRTNETEQVANRGEEEDGNRTIGGDENETEGTEHVVDAVPQEQGEEREDGRKASVKRALEFLTDEDLTKWEQEEREAKKKNCGEEKKGNKKQVEEKQHGKSAVRRRSSGSSNEEEWEEGESEEEEEEDEDDAYNMSSLRSSCSSGIQKSSEYGSGDDRPVSAENLLPESSIASITTHDEASRLSSVLHGSSCLTLPANRMLTRQQTFPPLQPYVRQRYMSTTGQELGNPAQLSDGSASSADTSSDSISPVPPPGGSGGSNSSVAPPSGGSTSPVPVVLSSGSSASINAPRIKRDASGETTSTGFPSKVPRMWREKENVAPPSSPRASDLLVSDPPLVKRNSLTIPQVSTRRRGSAPVGQDSILKNLIERQSRRGSVPSEVSIKPPSSTTSQSQQQCSVLNTLDSNGSMGLPRRSSLPYDLVKHSLSPTSIGYSGERRSSDGGGVTRGSKRRMNKLLKRRSSGGPDLILAPNNSPSSTLAPRRGSLPLEVIASSLYSSGTP
uniref:Serine/threonine-protein phosphatase 4 regulatory subunit 1 n=1 Tax=Cacopsylla melanoneura TaxID=428564 RepID=A0A8D8WYR6_9HEMI